MEFKYFDSKRKQKRKRRENKFFIEKGPREPI
jgi:hypothetical protein